MWIDPVHRRQAPRPGLGAALAAVALGGCHGDEPWTLAFDQAPAITIEAGESVNLSVTPSGEPPDDLTLIWEADCGHVMGLTRRGSYVAPDAAAVCQVSATSFADPAVVATLQVTVTAATGGGAVRWTLHVASDLDESVRKVAATADGGVVALVETNGDLGGPPQGDLDVVVVRYDAVGTRLWTRALATPTREFAGDVVVGPDGQVWVVGTTYGALDGTSAGESDAFVAELDADGAIVGIHQFGTERADTAQGVVVGADGDLFVAGWTEGDLDGNLGLADGYLRRVTPDGDEVWTRQFGGVGIDFAIGVALDGDDAVVVGTTDGAVDGPSLGGQDAYLARVGADGEVLALTSIGATTDDRAYGVASRPGGGVVVSGSFGDDAFVRAFDGGDAEVWTYPIATVGTDLGQAVEVDAAGDVVVVGSTSGDLGTPNVGFFDAFAIRLAPDGAARWTRRFGSAADDYAWDVALATDGDVVIGGRTDGILADGYGAGGDGFLRRLGP